MSDEVKNKRNNRKRKKSFLKNAKKYGKRGYYGRGKKVDEETYSYFVQIMETYSKGFPSEEEKLIFANNVLEQTENTEVDVSSNQVGCRVIETLLPFANDEILERFLTAFSADLRPLCSDRFASHVIEALLNESTKRSLIDDNENKEKFKDYAIKLSKFLLNNLEDYMWDTYGNHTARSVLHSLGHIPKNEKENHKKEEVEVKIEIPDHYKSILNDFGNRLIVWPQFKEFPNSDLTSGFLQVLLKVLQRINGKLLEKYLNKLLDESFVPEEVKANILPAVFMSKSNIVLLEVALQVAGEDMFRKIYEKCFKGRINKLANIRNTNFTVQRLFGNVKGKEEFEEMFGEIDEHFKEIIESGHSGVLLVVGQTCKRLLAKQGNFIQSMMKALDCFEPADRQDKFILALCKFTPFDKIGETANLETEKLNLHGTLLLQLMLEFNRPAKIVSGLMSLDSLEIQGLFSNSMGSHIVDSFMKSQYVGIKSREKMFRKLEGCYQHLASTKFGSRSFEVIFNVAGMGFKLSILNELNHKNAGWTHSQFGKIISSKIMFDLYKRNKDDWKNSYQKEPKDKNLIEEVLGS